MTTNQQLLLALVCNANVCDLVCDLMTTPVPETKYTLPVPILGYTIKYSTRLVRTGLPYSYTKLLIPPGLRMSTAGEELALESANAYAISGMDFRTTPTFDDIFGRNDSHWYAQQLTETSLRVPKGRDPNSYETDIKGRRYWPRIVLIGDKETRDVRVPEGNGRVVVEWDDVFGIPCITEADSPQHPGITHFWFESSLNYDIGVIRSKNKNCNAHGGCLDLLIGCYYADASSCLSYRLVRPASTNATAKQPRTNLDSVVQKIASMDLSRPPSTMTESARALLRTTESSGERFRRQLTERPVDNLLRQMRAPPIWRPPY